MPKHVASCVAKIASSRQAHRGDRLRGDAFAAAGEAEAFGRRRLHADAASIERKDLRDARAHRFAVRPDLRPLADQRDVDMAMHAALRCAPAIRRMRQEHMRRRAAPAFVRGRKMLADIAGAERAQDRVGQRVQSDIGVGMAFEAASCGTFTPHSQT